MFTYVKMFSIFIIVIIFDVVNLYLFITLVIMNVLFASQPASRDFASSLAAAGNCPRDATLEPNQPFLMGWLGKALRQESKVILHIKLKFLKKAGLLYDTCNPILVKNLWQEQMVWSYNLSPRGGLATISGM